MLYVTLVLPATTPPPSPRARELAVLLARVTEEYVKAHPSTTRAEVRQALRLAGGRTGGGSDRSRLAVITLVGFVLSLVLVSILAVLLSGG